MPHGGGGQRERRVRRVERGAQRAQDGQAVGLEAEVREAAPPADEERAGREQEPGAAEIRRGDFVAGGQRHHSGSRVAVEQVGRAKRAVDVEDRGIQRGDRRPRAHGQVEDLDREQVAQLHGEQRPGQLPQVRRAEADAGEIEQLGLDQEGQRDPLVIELQEDGCGCKHRGESRGGVPPARTRAEDGAGQIRDGSGGEELPDTAGRGVAPLSERQAEEADGVQRQQRRVRAEDVEGLEEQPVHGEDGLHLPQAGRPYRRARRR